MKKFIVSLIILVSSQALAGIICDGLPKKVDNDYVYAEVISRSHMDLEFAMVGD